METGQDIRNSMDNQCGKDGENMLEFINKIKDRDDLGMAMDNWMYNEIKKLHKMIASLQGKIIILEEKLDEESKLQRDMES